MKTIKTENKPENPLQKRPALVEAWQIPPKRVISVNVQGFYAQDYPSMLIKYAVTENCWGPASNTVKVFDDENQAEEFAAQHRDAILRAEGK